VLERRVAGLRVAYLLLLPWLLWAAAAAAAAAAAGLYITRQHVYL